MGDCTVLSQQALVLNCSLEKNINDAALQTGIFFLACLFTALTFHASLYNNKLANITSTDLDHASRL